MLAPKRRAISEAPTTNVGANNIFATSTLTRLMMIVQASPAAVCSVREGGRYSCPWVVSPVDAGGRDSSANEVIVSEPRAADSSTSVASSSERA